MLKLKYHVILTPLVFFLFCLILGVDWLRTILYPAGILIIAAITYHIQSGVWGEWASKRLRNTLLYSLVWFGILIWIWVVELPTPEWRLFLATVLIVLYGVFELLDAYIWYKKERHELEEVERKSKENV